MTFYYCKVNQHILDNVPNVLMMLSVGMLYPTGNTLIYHLPEAIMMLFVLICPAAQGDSRVELQRHVCTRCQVSGGSLH